MDVRKGRACRRIFAMVFLSVYVAQGQPWGKLLTINLTDQQREALASRSVAVFTKKLPFPATQLLFSWNALRPKQGYFTFSLRVKDAETQQWSRWFRAVQWGAGVQRSFKDVDEGGWGHHHVRFQMLKGHYADAVKVRVQCNNDASLSLLYRLAIAANDVERFASERGTGRSFDLPSVHIAGVPRVSQMVLDHKDFNRICSPTALSMAVSYLNEVRESPLAFARRVYDRGLAAYGSWPFNTAHAFVRTRGAYYFSVAGLTSFAHLYRYLSRDLPVVVSVRGPLRTMPVGRTYEDGHLLLVVGWDNERKRVLCHDPAFTSNEAVLHSYAINDFLAAWERSFRLAYVIEPRD